MRAYMGYDAQVGPSEGAALIFARTAKAAKKAFWVACSGMIVEEFVDARVEWLKDRPWLFDEGIPVKIAAGVAHVIDSPLTCNRCETWGTSKIGLDRLCEGCREPKDSS